MNNPATSGLPDVHICWDLSIQPSNLDALYARTRSERLILSERLHCQLNAAVILVIGLHFRRQVQAPFVLDLFTWLVLLCHALLWLLSFKKSTYLAWRTSTVLVLRLLLVAYGSISLLARSGSLTTYSAGMLNPSLVVLLSTAGFAHAFNKPLDMLGLQLPFAQEVLVVTLSGVLDLCSGASDLFVTSISRPGVFEVTQHIYERADLGMQFITSIFSSVSPFIEPYNLTECRPCGALVLLVFTHVVIAGILLYVRFITEWRDRIGFLRIEGQQYISARSLEAEADRLGTSLLVDCSGGWWRSVLAHAAAVLAVFMLAWSTASVIVADILPLVLATERLATLCPAGPVA